MKNGFVLLLSVMIFSFYSCKKKSSTPAIVPPAPKLMLNTIQLNGNAWSTTLHGVNRQPVIRMRFTSPVKQSTMATALKLSDGTNPALALNITYESKDSVVVAQPVTTLSGLTQYFFTIDPSLKSAAGADFVSTVDQRFITQIDSSRKFPLITDNELLDKVQQQTFKYFWDLAHPVSGLARERNTSADLVTSGGSGFGIMAMVAAINRNFITKAQGLQRLQTIVAFLKNNAQKFHGAFPHWLNGANGTAIAFSTKDNGADLVETSFLMMGLLTARQYFNGADAAEVNLRNDITALYNAVEWSWFRKNNEQVLYWHWSTNYGWEMNLPIRGWNECLITYVLAASSPTYGIPKSVYTQGWAANGTNGFINGNSYYNIPLPLGSAYGGPLFFSHYSFLGINPN